MTTEKRPQDWTVDRFYEAGATQGSIAKEPGITGIQLKTWRLEIEAFGSAQAKRRQKADAAELERLRKDNVSGQIVKPFAIDSTDLMAVSL